MINYYLRKKNYHEQVQFTLKNLIIFDDFKNRKNPIYRDRNFLLERICNNHTK